MNVAVFDCYSGIAGDMTIGAMLDAGFDFKLLSREIGKLKLRGVKLAWKKVKRGFFSGTKFDVLLGGSSRHHHTHLSDIEKIISKSRLHARVKELSVRMFRMLARAEAKVHGTSVGRIAFHEVGAFDSIVDIVGTAVCLHHLGIRKVFVRNLHVGSGETRTQGHGKVMLPSPGTLELLRGFSVHHAKIPFEMVTPTGAAILATLAEKTEDLPQVEVTAVGYGAGSMMFPDRPNLLRVTVGKISSRFRQDRILILETNLDDMNPLGFETLYRRLFETGALDVFVTPVFMKKIRPAYKLTVLFEHRLKARISEIVFRETTTFGVRFLEVDRFVLERRKISVRTRFGQVSVKVGSLDGHPHVAAPEYEDCKRIAMARRIPFREVYQEAGKKARSVVFKGESSEKG